jgi:hypothetical protein
MSDRERAMMFHRGFGDGAKASAKKHPSSADYMAGWRAGSEAATSAFGRWAMEQGIEPDGLWVLR